MNEMKRKPELIAEMIREAQTIAVVSHVNPDGDTLACATAMRLGLLKLGKEVFLFCDGKIPDQLDFLPGAELFRIPEGNEGPFDLMLAVDVSDEKRKPEDRPDRSSSDKPPVHGCEQRGRKGAGGVAPDP